MDRRSFLNSLTAFAATAVLDPERLLWRPTKTIFIPPAPKSVLESIIRGGDLTFDGKYFSVDVEFTAEELEEATKLEGFGFFKEVLYK